MMLLDPLFGWMGAAGSRIGKSGVRGVVIKQDSADADRKMLDIRQLEVREESCWWVALCESCRAMELPTLQDLTASEILLRRVYHAFRYRQSPL